MSAFSRRYSVIVDFSLGQGIVAKADTGTIIVGCIWSCMSPIICLILQLYLRCPILADEESHTTLPYAVYSFLRTFSCDTFSGI